MTEISRGGLVQNRIELGIFYYSVGVFAMSVLDACAKWLSTNYSVPQIALLESSVGLTLVLLINKDNAFALLRTEHLGLQITRGLFTLGVIYFFFFGVRYFRLADIVAVVASAPLIMLVLASLLLKERINLTSKLAVLVGFFGAMLIIKPGWTVVQWAAILPACCALCYASAAIVSRKLAPFDNPWTTLAYSQTIIFIISAPLTLFYWLDMTPADIFIIIVMGIAGTTSVYLRIKSFRYAPVNVVAPFDYTGIGWATIFGFVIWAEFPDLIVWLGIIAIALSGIYLLKQTSKKAPRPSK